MFAPLTNDKHKSYWVAGLTSVVLIMLGVAFYSPELYRMFCDVTGYGGDTQRVVSTKETTKTDDSVAVLPEVTVYFDANTDKRLPWRFVPEQRHVTVKVGETKQIFYRAYNMSDKTIVGQATFNVAPFQFGSYFFKAECFCFTEQVLEPYQEARMPVVFYIEKEMLEDNDVKDLRDVTLSYTFYRLKDIEADGMEMQHGDTSEHDSHSSPPISNLKDTADERRLSIERGEEQKFAPAGVHKNKP